MSKEEIKKGFLAGFLLLTLVLAGCGEQTEKKPEGTASRQEAETEPETGRETETAAEGETETAEKMQAEVKTGKVYEPGTNIRNAVKLFDVIDAKDTKANTLFSPLSLNHALGMLAEGSSGTTREQIDDYLGTADYSAAAAGYMERADRLNQDTSGQEYGGYKTALNIADSLWLNSDLYRFNQEYREKVSDSYRAESEELSFADPNAVCKQVNGWCDQKTEGMIPEILVPDALTDETVLILANALYFESPWLEGWNFYETPQEFTRFDGTAEQTGYMEQDVTAYYENEKAQAFGARYMNGMYFIGILPKTEGEFTLEELDIAGLLQSSRTAEYTRIHARMPKLTFETSVNLKESLPAAGVSDIFLPTGEIDGIAASAEGSTVPLCVSSAVQKTKIELDENGTRAAAVTAMMLDNCAMPPEDPKETEVSLDRPFAFLIYDEEAGEILFMGKVTSSQMEE